MATYRIYVPAISIYPGYAGSSIKGEFIGDYRYVTSFSLDTREIRYAQNRLAVIFVQKKKKGKKFSYV